MIRFGMIGAGRSAKRLVYAVNSIDEAKIVCVAAKSLEEAQSFASNNSIRRYCEDYQKILKSSDIEAVIISTPHFLHHTMIRDALNAGKHVLCEKPFVIDITKGKDLIELAQKKDLKIGVVFQKRFHDAFKKTKQIIGSGVLGKIHQAQINVFWNRDKQYFKESPWRNLWKTAGGGVLMIHSIHFIDLMIWFLGMPEVKHAMIKSCNSEIEVEDNAAILLKFPNEIFCSVQASLTTCPELPATIKIFGSEGNLSIEGFNCIYRKSDGSKKIIPEINEEISADDYKNIARVRLFKEFINSIKNKTSFSIDGEEGLKSVEIINEIYKKAKI